MVRVGAWHLPLAPLLNAMLDAGFRIARTIETGPAIPGEFSLLALKPSETSLSSPFTAQALLRRGRFTGACRSILRVYADKGLDGVVTN